MAQPNEIGLPNSQRGLYKLSLVSDDQMLIPTLTENGDGQFLITTATCVIGRPLSSLEYKNISKN